MKTLPIKWLATLIAIAALTPVFAQNPPPSGTTFSYQGQLLVGGIPTNALYDIRFALIDVASNSIVATHTNFGVSVQNGLFTTLLDLGPVFDGRAYSLQLAVRPFQAGGGNGAFVDLNPPNLISPAPSAIFAGTLGGLPASSFWQNGGNPGLPGGSNFLGTSDFQPFGLGVDGQPALRILPTQFGIANLVGGSLGNIVFDSVTGSSIGGGGWLNPLFGCNKAENTISANNSFIGSGTGNTISPGADSSVIGGGDCNLIDTNSAEAFIGGGTMNIIATTTLLNGSASTIMGGYHNRVSVNNYASTIGGGLNNLVGGDITEGTVAGGFNNQIQSGNSTTISGGQANRISAGTAATIAGGFNNHTYGGWSVIGGGRDHISSAAYSTVSGGSGNTIETNAESSAISGGTLNLIQAGSTNSFIGGGSDNTIQANVNIAKPFETMGAAICGGLHNTIGTYGAMAFIGGGVQNTISEYSSFIGSGENNSIEGGASVVCGGELNDVQGYSSCIGGGENNVITGQQSMIPGGYFNQVTGNLSFAAGYYAHASHAGCFVWSDSAFGGGIAFPSIRDFEFAARARGGVRFVTAVDGSGNPTAGVKVDPGGTSWTTISDRNAKKNFATVNGEEVLQKLANVPVESWNYRWESDDAVPNIGPMAQDFKHAFYPGRDDKSISTLEFDGVELAAIKGLNEKLEAKESQIKQQAGQIEDLQRQVDELKSLVRELARRAGRQP